jgi:hypothetical protein
VKMRLTFAQAVGIVVKQLAWLVGLCLLVWAGFSVLGRIPQQAPPPAETFAREVIARMDWPQHWGHLELDSARWDFIVLKLHYLTEFPKFWPNPELVEADGAKVVRAMLAGLMQRGAHPAHDQTRIWCWVQSNAGRGGETGGPMVKIYGRSQYIAAGDRIEFKEWDNDNMRMR